MSLALSLSLACFVLFWCRRLGLLMQMCICRTDDRIYIVSRLHSIYLAVVPDRKIDLKDMDYGVWVLISKHDGASHFYLK